MKRLFLLLTLLYSFVSISLAQTQTFKSLSSDEFAQLIAKRGVQLVDVRTEKEYAEGHLKNALNMDVLKPEFDTQIQQLKKKHPVAVYCRGGKRSKVAAQKLTDKGYQVYELDRGFVSWKGEVVK